MPTRVVMTGGPARSEDGLSMLLQGQSYTVSDEYARYLIRARGAVDADNVNPFVTFPGDVQLVESDQVALKSLVSVAGISDVTYDGSSRVSGYTANGVVHTVTYPTGTSALITNTLGASRSVTFDGSGRVTAII